MKKYINQILAIVMACQTLVGAGVAGARQCPVEREVRVLGIKKDENVEVPNKQSAQQALKDIQDQLVELKKLDDKFFNKQLARVIVGSAIAVITMCLTCLLLSEIFIPKMKN